MCSLLKRAKLSALPVLAVCKEVEKDGDNALGIEAFEKKYFCGPVYHDVELAFYKHLGRKKIGLNLGKLFRPWAAVADIRAMSKRIKEGKVDGNLKGEGIVKGGILVIGRDDKVVYTYYEQTGTGIPSGVVKEIAEAARSLR